MLEVRNFWLHLICADRGRLRLWLDAWDMSGIKGSGPIPKGTVMRLNDRIGQERFVDVFEIFRHILLLDFEGSSNDSSPLPQSFSTQGVLHVAYCMK